MPKAKKSRSSNAGIAPSMPYSVGVKKEDTVRGQAQSNNNLIAPNTSIGQHFLKNPAVVNSIVQKSGVKVGFYNAFLAKRIVWFIQLILTPHFSVVSSANRYCP
jgi:hypothetical protein